MLKSGEKLGAFIVPTGVGASIGGFAGDASAWGRKFSQKSKLIVNPNVVNAGCFSGINGNMLYVEGYSIDEFFKGNLNLILSESNKIGVVFDKSIPKDVLNVHLNTINAVKTVYGIDIIGYEVTDNEVGVGFKLESNGISTGSVDDVNTLIRASEKLLMQGAEAIALVCMFEDPESCNEGYANGIGTDPVGGVEAILSHCISKELKVPCAHAPAFRDYQIYSDLVDKRAAAEYITPTFLPCVLIGLASAPTLSEEVSKGINIKDLDYLVMPYNSLGSIPVFEAIKNNIKIYAVKENKTVLNVTKSIIAKTCSIIEVDTYKDCFELI